MDRRAWWSIVHGGAKSQTGLTVSVFTFQEFLALEGADGPWPQEVKEKSSSLQRSGLVRTVILSPNPGPAARLSKAIKEARLVERKVCFILDAGKGWGSGARHLSKDQLLHP